MILLTVSAIAVATELAAIWATEYLVILWLTGHIQPWRPSWT